MMTTVNIDLFVEIWETKYDPQCESKNSHNQKILQVLMYGED